MIKACPNASYPHRTDLGIIRHIAAAAVVASACTARSQKIDDLCHALPPKSTAASIHFRSTDVYWRIFFPHFRRIILFFWTFLDAAVAFLFIHSLKVVRLEKYETPKRGVYNNNIFQTRLEVRRCGGMRQKHCILYYSGALMLHNIIVLDARGRALCFLIKTCAVLFRILYPFPYIDRENVHCTYVCLYMVNITVVAQ